MKKMFSLYALTFTLAGATQIAFAAEDNAVDVDEAALASSTAVGGSENMLENDDIWGKSDEAAGTGTTDGEEVAVDAMSGAASTPAAPDIFDTSAESDDLGA